MNSNEIQNLFAAILGAGRGAGVPLGKAVPAETPAPEGDFASLLTSLGEGLPFATADGPAETGADGPVRFDPPAAPSEGWVEGKGNGPEAPAAKGAEVQARAEAVPPRTAESVPPPAADLTLPATEGETGGDETPSPFPKTPEGETRVGPGHGPSPFPKTPEGETRVGPGRRSSPFPKTPEGETRVGPGHGPSPAESPTDRETAPTVPDLPKASAPAPASAGPESTAVNGPAVPAPKQKVEVFDGGEITKKPSPLDPAPTGDRRKPESAPPESVDPPSDRAPEKESSGPAPLPTSARAARKGTPAVVTGESAPPPPEKVGGFERAVKMPEAAERAEPRPPRAAAPPIPESAPPRRIDPVPPPEAPAVSESAPREGSGRVAPLTEPVRTEPIAPREARPLPEPATPPVTESGSRAPAPDPDPEGPKFDRFTRIDPAPARAGGDPDLPVLEAPREAPVEEIGIEQMRVRFVRGPALREPAAPPRPSPSSPTSAPGGTARQLFTAPFPAAPALPGGIDGLRAVTRSLGAGPAGYGSGIGTGDGVAEEIPVAEVAEPRERNAEIAAETFVTEEALDGPDELLAAAARGRSDAGGREWAARVLEAARPVAEEGAPAATAFRPAPSGNPAGATAGEPWSAAAPSPREGAPSSNVTEARPAAPNPLAFREEILGRIADGMRATLRRGRNEAEIRLDPPELGRVHLKLAVSHSAVHGVIHVDSAAVKALVESDLPRLGAALGESGIDLSQFDVLLHDERRPSDGRGDPERRGPGAGAFVEEEETEPAEPAIAAAAGGTGRVDYLF